MSTRDQLLALATRCEAASGPDRELDEAIALATGWTHRTTRDTPGWEAPLDPRAPGTGMIMGPGCKPYTTSLDAALSLVPEGAWGGEISWNFGEVRKGGYVELNCANPAWLVPDYDPSQPPHEHAACVTSYEASETTKEGPKALPFALALCAAALRARAALA